MGLERCSLVICAALAALISGSTAHASVPERVAQDDATVVCRWHDRQQALEQMRGAGFSHVRINLIHARGADGTGLEACSLPATLEEYDQAVAAVRAAGLIPQLTLVWSRQTNAEAIAAWMGEMAAHFAPEVHRFSVLNEPDLSLPASDACDPETVQQMVSTGTLRVSQRVRLVLRYLRHRVRIRRRGKTTLVWRDLYRYRSARRPDGRGWVVRRMRAYRWVKQPFSVLEAGTDSSQQPATTVRQGCLRVQRARMYREIFNAAEPAIRTAAPGAEVLAGETSPVAPVDVFIENALPLHADGWAHHCYQWDLTPSRSTGGFGIGDTSRVQALVGMPLFYTECGYPNPDSEWSQLKWGGFFSHDNLTGAYPAMWQYARDEGVREMSQFGWCATPPGRWDTSLMTRDDCLPSAEYLALRQLLASWG